MCMNEEKEIPQEELQPKQELEKTIELKKKKNRVILAIIAMHLIVFLVVILAVGTKNHLRINSNTDLIKGMPVPFEGLDLEDENYLSALDFLVEIEDFKDSTVYDYIIGNEEFNFTTVYLQVRWNDMIHDINQQFNWGMEGYDYVANNYDDLWESLKEQLRADVAVTLLAYLSGCKPDEDELADFLDSLNFFISNNIHEDEDIDEVLLQIFGLAKDEFILQTERNFSALNMVDEFWESIEFSESMMNMVSEQLSEELEDMFAMANVYHILVDSHDKAQEIYEKMIDGVHPVDLHDEFSLDPGGPHYIFPRGHMVESFEDWAFSAEQGDIGIIESQFGYHVTLSYGKEVNQEELENFVKIHYTETHFMNLINDMGIRWASNPDNPWIPKI